MRLIDADVLIDEIKSIVGEDAIMWFDNRKINREQAVNMAAFINAMPTIDPVKHGKWKRIDKDNMFFAPHILQCSICGNILDTHGVNAGRGDANYCPVCGAKMSKGDEEE